MGLTYAGPVPLVPRLIIAALLVLAGLALLAVAVLGARGRLRRNRWIGVRTTETLASEAAFALANRVAAAPVGAAGAVALVGGAVLAAGPVGAVSVVVLAVAVVGTLVLGAFGGMVGQRAAATVPVEPEPVACGGVCAGCDLVAGCRPTSPTSPDLP
ncbi:SdpI family protein [Pseudonocardia petroleophila]|uniref:SdpI family protein n=1 Tax=Pseudonocardia petroleophila TaxID=37331 RepID=A0A7G7MRR0_9PSEU|nr:SdpI family protein [Pseudonocardia petroleophila]